jgi:hypothetical protein
MMLFILLSGRQALISSFIFEGRAEFERNINRITVDIRSSSFILPPPPPFSTTTLPSPPQFAADRTQTQGHKPLPSTEGCGLKKQRLVSSDARPPPTFSNPRKSGCICPSPLHMDVGNFECTRSRDLGPGGCESRGPRYVQKRRTTEVVPRFSPVLSCPF